MQVLCSDAVADKFHIFNKLAYAAGSNPNLSIKSQDLEFSDVEMARIKAAIRTWDSYAANADRKWLQPLVDRLLPPYPQE